MCCPIIKVAQFWTKSNLWVTTKIHVQIKNPNWHLQVVPRMTWWKEVLKLQCQVTKSWPHSVSPTFFPHTKCDEKTGSRNPHSNRDMSMIFSHLSFILHPDEYLMSMLIKWIFIMLQYQWSGDLSKLHTYENDMSDKYSMTMFMKWIFTRFF